LFEHFVGDFELGVSREVEVDVIAVEGGEGYDAIPLVAVFPTATVITREEGNMP